jgi:hypothetical protein
MKDNPIVTVKLVDVSVSGYIGPNTRISLEVLGLGKKIDVGVGAKKQVSVSESLGFGHRTPDQGAGQHR